MKYGYWVDLKGVELDEQTRAVWLQAAPLGEYNHALYGKLSFTPEKVQRLSTNIKNNVRGTDLDIDYDHKAHTGKAAGWVRDAEDRGTDGLWIQVEFTEDGYKAVKNGEYRYFSPEYVDSWEHPKSGEKYQDVLFGGAITNRPHLKDILPINASELPEGGEVDEFLKELRTKLGLPEDATQEQILGAAKVQETPNPDPTPEPDPEPTPEPEPQVDDDKELAKLAEANPVVAKMLSEQRADRARIVALEAATRLSEADTQIANWASGKKFAIPPSANEHLRKMLTEASGSQHSEFVSFVSEILDKGLVELGERGNVDPSTQSGDPVKAMDEGIKKLMETDKLSYADAAVKFSELHPDIHEAYVLSGGEQ